MTDFTLDGFVAKLTELVTGMQAAEHAALERAARLVQAGAKAEVVHLGGTGELGNSIDYTVMGREAYIGSNDEAAEYQELGTADIPPRSFLGSALAHTTDDVVKTVGDGAVGALIARG